MGWDLASVTSPALRSHVSRAVPEVVGHGRDSVNHKLLKLGGGPVRADALHVGHQSRRQCEYLQPLSWLGHCLPCLHGAGGGVEGGGGGARFCCCRCGECWGRPVLRARPGEGGRGVAAGGVWNDTRAVFRLPPLGAAVPAKAGSSSMVVGKYGDGRARGSFGNGRLC